MIGWGSLIWDLDDLAPKVRGSWAMSDGPALPLEFSRISPKRLMGLVVIVDHTHGAACPTHWIASARASIDAVTDDLAARERTTPDFIGSVCRDSGLERGPAPVTAAVRDWCASKGLRGAVWTDLPANFSDHTGAPYSLDAAHSYLRGLEGDSQRESVRYIENAPATTDTPLRRSLATAQWWQERARRHL